MPRSAKDAPVLETPAAETPAAGSCSVWLPPQVRESFLVIRRALDRGRFSQVDYLSRKFQKRYLAYAGYYLDMEANAHKLRRRGETALKKLEEANAFFQGANLSTLRTLIRWLLDRQEPERARPLLEQGLRLFPGDRDLQLSCCRMFLAQGQLRKSLAGLRALCEEADDADAWYLRGDCCFQLGLHDEGMDAYTRALELRPGFEAAWLSKIFLAHYIPGYTQSDLQTLIRDWYASLRETLSATDPSVLQRPLDPDKKLRIGFLSPGFHVHPVGWMTGHALLLLSKLPDCELYFYSLQDSPNTPDPLRPMFRHAAAKWVDAVDWDRERLYRKLLADKLDIAVDLAGHGERCMLPLFARRIAPIQVKWVGSLFNTTGVPAMDYLLSDRFQTPDGCDGAYTEKLVRLPHSYISYDLRDFGDTERPDDDPRRPLCFASFNNLYKLNPVIAGVWADILKRVPHSVLLLKTHALHYADTRDFARSLFTEQGIAPERIVLEGPSKHGELMRAYRRVDIALDTWPYTGGLTTLEALWMGVPVITTPGPSFAGRHALSHLCNVGLESLVTDSFESYIATAVKLAADRDLLEELRVLLPHSLATAPLVRHEQLAADLHTAFRAMWSRHCRGLPPVAMRFDQPSAIPGEFKAFIRNPAS